MNRMKKMIIMGLIFSTVIAACKKEDDNGDNGTDPAVKYKTVKIMTDFGDFRIWLYQETPLHRDNFIDLTESGYYDSIIFHRVIEDFVVQGGDPEGTGFGGPDYTIPAEFVAALKHDHGAVGMARMPDNVNPDKESHGSQFYIVVDQNGEPSLDGHYTVFGYVFDGIQAVMDISHVETDTNDKPLNDVFILSAVTEEYTASELKNEFGFDVP